MSLAIGNRKDRELFRGTRRAERRRGERTRGGVVSDPSVQADAQCRRLL